MTQHYHNRTSTEETNPQVKRSVRFDEHATDRKNKDLPQIPASRARRKLRKARTVYEAPRPTYHGMPRPFPEPLNRSESMVSEDSAGHLLQTAAPNRANQARYPRPAQPAVLKKRRRDGGRRYHSFPPSNRGQEIRPILQHPQPNESFNYAAVPVNQPLTQEQFGRNPPLDQRQSPNEHRRHSISTSENVLFSPTPSMTSSQRRWSMLDSPNLVAANILGPSVIPVERNKGKEKELPALPETTQDQETEKEQEASSSAQGPSNLPPLPLYTEASSAVLDTSHQARLRDDLIQGERAYLDTLRQCVKNEDIFATSLDLLLSLLSLIQVGEDFIAELTGSPTPEHVASAFLSICRPLETALLKWSEEMSRVSIDEAQNPESAPTPTPPTSPPPDANPRRLSILKRVSVLWGRKPKHYGGGSRVGNATANTATIKPDRVWRKQGNPGLWEMSVLPAQRVTQYRYILRDMLSNIPESHPSFLEFERAYHASTFISEKVARAQASSSTS
ncbi:hypothetical protein MD484_g2002, partial [Candolleomyces efflorescens]